jgi:hypothetical protein
MIISLAVFSLALINIYRRVTSYKSTKSYKQFHFHGCYKTLMIELFLIVFRKPFQTD